MEKKMTGALMQDQWEAGAGQLKWGYDIRVLPSAPDGFVPVQPERIASAFHFLEMIELKEDE